jgi:hypothetical protein
MRTAGRPWLFLGEGWVPDERGVWTVTPHARADADFMAGRHGDARRGRYDAKGDTVPDTLGAEGMRPSPLPVSAVCPWCRSIHDLRAEALGVDDHGLAPGRGSTRGIGRFGQATVALISERMSD